MSDRISRSISSPKAVPVVHCIPQGLPLHAPVPARPGMAHKILMQQYDITISSSAASFSLQPPVSDVYPYIRQDVAGLFFAPTTKNNGWPNSTTTSHPRAIITPAGMISRSAWPKHKELAWKKSGNRWTDMKSRFSRTMWNSIGSCIRTLEKDRPREGCGAIIGCRRGYLVGYVGV
jgi:hypothetical protein